MLIQILIVVLFALNLWLLWSLRKNTAYSFLGSFLLVVLPLVSVFFDQPRFALDFFWWRVAGVIAIILGVGLLIWAKMAIGKMITNVAAIPDSLVTSGPYAYLRHPMYLGLIFINVGWWWVWAAVYSFYFGMFILVLFWVQAYLEEKLILDKQFGDQYAAYRRATGMFWIK
jgi:protein-S-isoprenylcysteine O-methyltransferase Ste14